VPGPKALDLAAHEYEAGLDGVEDGVVAPGLAIRRHELGAGG
jgi:hypothetical protein